MTRLLALGELPVKRAIIDGGITPYQMPYLIRKLLLARDMLSFKLAANNRKILEAAFPPERFTLPGRDPKKEYDAIEAYLKTYSDQTIRNIFWSGNNYVLPKTPAKIGTKITYWYGDEEKKDRRSDIRFIKHYFPQARIHGIPKMAHAELVMISPPRSSAAISINSCAGKEEKTMDRKENIRNAYRLTGSNNFYDGMITCSTVSGKAVCRLVWDMGKEECGEYLNKAFTGVPEDFAGKLLEVPVGTGILTMPLYQTLPRADITCLDYSPDMMGQAREKAERMGLQNVQFRQGDVGALPYEDSSFDIVLSLNGFHAFPDKEAAYRETFRVLKPGGTFCGCFYVSGECRRTDRLIKKVYEPMKFFTPPYETVQSLKVRLEGMYADVQLGNVKSIAWFVCRKAERAKKM